MKVAPTYLLPPRKNSAQQARRSFLVGSLAIAAGFLGGAWLLRRPAFADSPPTAAHTADGDALVDAARQLAAPGSPDQTLLEQRQVFLAGLHLDPRDAALWHGASRLTGLLVIADGVPDRTHCLATIQRLAEQEPEASRRHAPLLRTILEQHREIDNR